MDLISRQAAIDALGEKPLVWDDLSDFDLGKAAQWSDDVDAIKNLQPTCNNLPSAQPQRMKGRWIHDGYDIPHGVDWMHCSVCGRREPHVPAAMTNYCPGCGADMRETE